jgi:hypothetical protein
MADKEVRFGIANTALWATATTDASNGSSHGGHDAFTAYGGAVPLVNIFGGGLAVSAPASTGCSSTSSSPCSVGGADGGPYAGMARKKIESREIRYAAVSALRADDGSGADGDLGSRRSSSRVDLQPRRPGFTETLYAYTSQSNNNGSAFAGFGLTNFSADWRRAMLLWPLHASSPRSRFYALGKKKIAGVGGHVPHRRADVRILSSARSAHRRADDLPGPDAGPARRGAEPLDAARSGGLHRRGRALHRRLASPFPGASPHRLRQVAFKSQAEWQPRSTRNGTRDRVGSLRVQSHKAAVLPRAPVRDVASRTTPPVPRSRTRPREPAARDERQKAAQSIVNEAPLITSANSTAFCVGTLGTFTVTTSGSGIDPDISPAYAQLQSKRIAAVRHLPLSTVQKLISENTDGRSLGFFGEPGVNVLELNLALDKETAQ